MDTVLNAFRLAHRASHVSTIEDGFKDIANVPTAIIERQVGSWEYQILAQAILILRRRELPQPDPTSGALFAQVAMALRTCLEITDDVADNSGGSKSPS